MTVSSDARTPSASVHALSGSTPPGSAPVVQPFGVATASAGVAEMPETFAPLGTIVAGIAGRLRPAHPDAAVIDLAGRVERLVKREHALWGRRADLEDAVNQATPPRPPPRPDMRHQMTSTVTTVHGARTLAVTEPAEWQAEHRDRDAAHAALVAEHERLEAEVGAGLGLPRVEKLTVRASRRLERWGLQLAAMRPTTQAGLKAKAAASMAVVEDGELLDDWRQATRQVVRPAPTPTA